MRIISGKAKGNKIIVPNSDTRPTTDRVREAVLSMLGPHVENAKVLDLFAGSGAFGLELLSRGAQSCVFVDQQKQACAVIKKNIAQLKFGESAEVISQDARTAIDGFFRRGVEFDIVLLDPPYIKSVDDGDIILELTSKESFLEVLDEEAFVIIEHSGKVEINNTELTHLSSKKYGNSSIEIYQKMK